MLSQGKLSFWGLTALVFGLVVGVGTFNLPQNMASVASPGAVAICWLIAALGILPLVMGFKWLSEHYPQYNAGIYHYAQAGFGNFTGFLIAWGYWLCSAFSNVAYGVMLNDTVGAFFPPLLKHGWWAVLLCSLMIWLMYFIVSRGIRTAKAVNSALAWVKIVMLVFIIAVFSIMFRADLFTADIWGKAASLTDSGLGSQIKETMMVALFCFFGVEGAVMVSSRAERAKDVGRAGVAGFLLALLLYMAISLLCFGLAAKAELAGMPNPSVAYLLKGLIGDWAYWFVISALTIALLGGWVAWTLVVAQVPYEAARVGILPKWFAHTNKKEMPDYGLFASSLAMEFFLLLIVFSKDAYMAALQITGLMIIPGYLFCGLFIWKASHGWGLKILAAVIILFCAWMAYAGGLKEFFMTSAFYLAGTAVYIRARREQALPGQRFQPFNRREMIILMCLVFCTVGSIAVWLWV